MFVGCHLLHCILLALETKSGDESGSASNETEAAAETEMEKPDGASKPSLEKVKFLV